MGYLWCARRLAAALPLATALVLMAAGTAAGRWCRRSPVVSGVASGALGSCRSPSGTLAPRVSGRASAWRPQGSASRSPCSRPRCARSPSCWKLSHAKRSSPGDRPHPRLDRLQGLRRARLRPLPAQPHGRASSCCRAHGAISNHKARRTSGVWYSWLAVAHHAAARSLTPRVTKVQQIERPHACSQKLRPAPSGCFAAYRATAGQGLEP